MSTFNLHTLCTFCKKNTHILLLEGSENFLHHSLWVYVSALDEVNQDISLWDEIDVDHG